MSWYAIRDGRPDDVPFIASSWLHSYAPAHHVAKAVSSPYLGRTNRNLGGELKRAYYEDHSPRVNAWLERGMAVVACLEADDGIVVGWACGEHAHGVAAVHYAYTKSAYRQQGVATALLAALAQRAAPRDIVATHITPMGQLLNASRRWPHVPWLAFRSQQTGDPSDATQAR